MIIDVDMSCVRHVNLGLHNIDNIVRNIEHRFLVSFIAMLSVSLFSFAFNAMQVLHVLKQQHYYCV